MAVNWCAYLWPFYVAQGSLSLVPGFQEEASCSVHSKRQEMEAASELRALTGVALHHFPPILLIKVATQACLD